jgi:tetratricopeptide (TPR) repeat protein
MRRESHQDWQRMDGGIDLADLAQRLGMNGRPAKLALLLFELKDVLLVTRASGHVAQRYHPGNFDIAMTISRRWPAELAATHRDRAGRGLELLAAPADAEALSDAELCGAIAHALLADLEHKLLDVNDRAGELLSARASAAHDESREHDAVALTSVGIALAERQLRAKFTLGAAWFLPVQLRHRAMAGLSMGRLRQASEDVDNAARLFESLRDMVDPRDRILIDREVAVTLGTRADIKTVLGDWHDALPDYGQAIELMTRGAGDGRLPDPRRPLATLLHNRARANGLCGADDKARADIDAAVALLSAAGDPDPVMLAQSLVLRSVAQWRDGNLDAAHLDARRAAGLVAPRPLDTDAVSADQLDIAASALGQFSRTSSGSGDYPGALRAAEEALRLRLALGERLGSAVTIAMQVGLANAYRDRGLALINLGRRDAGFADIDTAVALGEAAGRAAGEDWEPNQREALGALYSARAMFLHRAGDPARVRADLARADELGFDARLLADTAPDLAHLLEQIHKHPS